MKTNQIKVNNAEALPVFGSLYFITRGCLESPRGHRKKNPGEVFEQAPEDKQNLFAEQKRKKRIRQKLQKQAEIIQANGDTISMLETSKRNNAGIRHIATFINLVECAVENGLGCALGMLKKRFKSQEEAVKEWRLIRNRLKRIGPEMCAVSIGRCPQGRWVIRWCAVANCKGQDIFCRAAPMHLYLANKRGWSSSTVTMEAESGKLQGHYLTRLDDDEETLAYFTGEMYELYRAALSMPKTSRTFRTKDTTTLLQSLAIPVSDIAAYVVNGTDLRYSSPSGRALCKVEKKKGKVVSCDWLCAKPPKEFDEDSFEEPLDDTEGEF